MNDALASVVLPSLVAAISAPLGAWVGSIVQRGKYRAEIDALRAEVDGRLSGNKASELENVRKASSILMENIVSPLKEEIQDLREDVQKFRIAVEQIHACDYAATCPVSRSLRLSEGATKQCLLPRTEGQQPNA